MIISKIKKSDWVVLFFLLLAVVAFRYPSFDLPLDHDSGSVAFLARQLTRGYILYDTFHPAHHLPGIYYTFELAFKLFGDNPNSPKVLLIFWELASTWFLYILGQLIGGKRLGILGALFFIMASSLGGLSGFTVEMEHFANLPMIAGVLLTIVLLQKKSPNWKFLWIGILGAICILYKITFVSSLAVAGVGILTAAWIEREQADVWKTVLSRIIWTIIGIVIPLVMVAGYFASLGLWNRFLLIFAFGFNYFNDVSIMHLAGLPPPFGFPIVVLTANNFMLLATGLLGVFFLFYQTFPLNDKRKLSGFLLAIWLIFTFAQTGLRGGGYNYYVLMTLSPLALTSAFAIFNSYEKRKLRAPRQFMAVFETAILIALIAANNIWTNGIFFSHYIPYKMGTISYDEFLANVDNMGEYNLSNTIVRYIQEHTNSDDFIYLWGEQVQLYYYTDRQPPIDILWTSYVSATGPRERIFNPRTKYIAVDDIKLRPQWLLDGLDQNYYLEVVIEGMEIYRRVKP